MAFSLYDSTLETLVKMFLSNFVCWSKYGIDHQKKKKIKALLQIANVKWPAVEFVRCIIVDFSAASLAIGMTFIFFVYGLCHYLDHQTKFN